MTHRPKILVTRPLPPAGMQLLEAECEVVVGAIDSITKEEIVRLVPGVEGIVCHYVDRIDAEVLDAAGPNLKVVTTFSVGFDLIQLEECKKRNIQVGHTPNVLSNSVAELTMALLLATSRRIKEGIESSLMAKIKWENGLFLCGPELVGATVGIVGLGRIGSAVAKRIQGFEISTLLYYDVAEMSWAADVGAKYASFEELITKSDFIIATCSSTPENWGLFDKAAFKKMKKTAIFINVTRGVLVNQDDLYEALTTGEIWAAGLDATTPEPLPADHPLLKLNNCIVLPHIGSATTTTRINMSVVTAQNLIAGLKRKPLICPVTDI